MNKFYTILILAVAAVIPGRAQNAQKVDSIFFHLYTDSLKKGTHNYINVDGKMSDGRWLPLTNKEIVFTASAGKFEGNSLVLDSGFAGDSVAVKAVLKNNPAIWREVIIYIKKFEAVERLKTMEEIMNQPPSRRNRRNSKSGLAA
jgi:hypothetical protein